MRIATHMGPGLAATATLALLLLASGCGDDGTTTTADTSATTDTVSAVDTEESVDTTETEDVGADTSAPLDTVAAADTAEPEDTATAEDTAAEDTEVPVDTTPACVPNTCEDLPDACGEVFDGCDAYIDCGECPCEPATCESLGIPCGSASDGCGETLDCGSCGACTDYPVCVNEAYAEGEVAQQCGVLTSSCDDGYQSACSSTCEFRTGAFDCVDGKCVCDSDDALEPNDSHGTAHDFGEHADDEHVCRWYDIRVDANDPDWFTFRVTDDWNFENPIVQISGVSGTIWYVCDDGGSGLTGCLDDEWENHPTLGQGCARQGTHHIECDGTSDETGQVYLRVDKDYSAETHGCEEQRLRFGLYIGGSWPCSPGGYYTPRFDCADGISVWGDACDGEQDCADGSDEADCP